MLFDSAVEQYNETAMSVQHNANTHSDRYWQSSILDTYADELKQPCDITRNSQI